MKSLSVSAPHIVAMAGIPGAGKTQFAEQFADMFTAPFISYPQLVALSDNPSASAEVALDLLTEVMKTKQTIIFEGLTEKQAERIDLTKFAKRYGYHVLFVWVQADQNAAKQRLAKHLSAATYDTLVKDFEPLEEAENHLVISGHHTYTTQARTVLKRLSEPSSTSPVLPRTVRSRAK